jgi:hypothetical protein
MERVCRSETLVLTFKFNGVTTQNTTIDVFREKLKSDQYEVMNLLLLLLLLLLTAIGFLPGGSGMSWCVNQF